MAENTGGRNYSFKNYNVSAGKGMLYQSSKTKEDEYEEVKTQSGATVYHRYVKSVTGFITKVEVKTANFPSGPVDQLVINVTDRENGVIQVVQMSLYNSKKNYSNAALAMLNILPNADKEKEVALGFYISKYTKQNGDEGENLNGSISYVGEQTEDGKPLNVRWIDMKSVPRGEKVEKRGTITYNFDARDDFYYEILEAVKEKFKFVPQEDSTTDKPTPPPQFSNNGEDDDLPF